MLRFKCLKLTKVLIFSEELVPLLLAVEFSEIVFGFFFFLRMGGALPFLLKNYKWIFMYFYMFIVFHSIIFAAPIVLSLINGNPFRLAPVSFWY